MLARESVLRWFPEARAKLQNAKITVHSKEFYGVDLRKTIADLVYTIELPDGSGVLPLTLILEHKAQSSKLENASTLAQTLEYVASHCREQIKLRRDGALQGPLLQPIAVLIYTGADVNLTDLTWSASFQLPDEFSDYRIRFPLRFLNMTQLCHMNRLEGSPFLCTAYRLMAAASLGQLDSIRKTAFSPLRAVTTWGPRENGLLQASTYFYIKSAVNAGLDVDQTTFGQLLSTVNRREDESMKSIWSELGEEINQNVRKRILEKGIDIGREEGIEKGIDIGRLETLKVTAASLRAEGLSDEKIAKILNVDVADVKIWLESDAQ